MKYLIIFVLMTISFCTYSQDKTSLLAAWENVQKNHSEVESFEKLSDKHYKIKFVNLPFEGELIILTYGIEDDNSFRAQNTHYTKSAYFELELVGATEEMLKKYRITYYKWSEDNNFYFNNNTGAWETRKVFSKHQMHKFKKNKVQLFLSEYKGYLLTLFLLYFVYIHIRYNKRMKDTMIKQSESIELHHETNKLLKDLLTEVQDRKL